LLPSENIAAVLEAAGIGVWEVDLLSRQVACSAGCKQLFGLPLTRPLELDNLRACVHPTDRDALFTRLRQAISPTGNGYVTVEHRVLLPDGQTRWVHSTGLARFGASGGGAILFQGTTQEIVPCDDVHITTGKAPATDFDFFWLSPFPASCGLPSRTGPSRTSTSAGCSPPGKPPKKLFPGAGNAPSTPLTYRAALRTGSRRWPAASPTRSTTGLGSTTAATDSSWAAPSPC